MEVKKKERKIKDTEKRKNGGCVDSGLRQRMAPRWKALWSP